MRLCNKELSAFEAREISIAINPVKERGFEMRLSILYFVKSCKIVIKGNEMHQSV